MGSHNLYVEGEEYGTEKFEYDSIKTSYINAKAGTVFQVGITALQYLNIAFKLLPSDA